jgi:ribose transport system substrate-binding protein
MRTHWRCVSGVAVTCGLLTLAGCGSSSGGTTAANGARTSTASAIEQAATTVAYDGPDAKYFGDIAGPQRKSGVVFKVGFLQPNGGQPELLAEQDAAERAVTQLGGSFSSMDAGLDVQKQVSQFNQLLLEGVKAILVYPVVPDALEPSIEKARAAGVTVVASDAVADAAAGPDKNFATSVDQPFDYQTYLMVKAAAARLPQGAQFSVMGLGLPVTSLQYMAQRTEYWGKRFGLNFVMQSDAQSDTPSAYAPAVSAILSAHPDVKAIFTFNDESALAAATKARASGKTGILVADPNSGEAIATQGIASGQLALAVRTPWEAMGRQMAYAAYDELTKQNLPLPRLVLIKPTLITKSNVNDVKPVN